MIRAAVKRIALLFLSLFLASSALAGEILIPAVYRGPGAFDTLWRTEIVVSNVTSDPRVATVPVTITYHGTDGKSSEIHLTLSQMEVYAIPDAVREWFDVENGGGIVRVTWDQADARVKARARIYTVGEHGQYGQSVPGVRPDRLESDVYLPGLSGVDGNRTNVGVSNPFNDYTMVWIELFDTSGLSRGAFATTIGPRTFMQFNDIFSYFQAGPLNAAMVRVSGVNLPVYAYASIVRNDTGDATFVSGQ